MTDAEKADLLAQRSNLVRAMRSGVLTVTHGEKSVKYRSMSELQSALSGLDAELGTEAGLRKRRVRYLSTTKGF
jgi:hypothetical protein